MFAVYKTTANPKNNGVSNLDTKLKQLPPTPGVYLYKDARGNIIYVGKAAVLKNRVKQYFQKSRARDSKTDALVADIADVDWIEVDSELDALFLEAELVRRYRPKYNILLRDDKSTAYVRITNKSQHPTVTITRRPLDDKAEYFGPYFNATAVRRALQYLRKAFPYSTHVRNIPRRACLQYHLGLCPGIEEYPDNLAVYKDNLQKLKSYLKGGRSSLIKSVEKEMKQQANSNNFEQAASLRNQLFTLKGLSRQIIFSDKEFLDISKDMGLSQLAELLGFERSPQRIEGFDISHMSGTDNTASMVVFSNGLPHKTAYRKFKMRLPGNDDFAHMNEAISRRLKPDNVRQWGLPDLFLIDGGKGQLSAAISARDKAGYSIPMIGLAKRDEEVVVANNDKTISLQPSNWIRVSKNFSVISLPKNSPALKLLQRIRDESHRFAVSYHSVLKAKRQTASQLEDIAGIGPATRKKLIKKFGSLRALGNATLQEISDVVGPQKAKLLHDILGVSNE
jgi:excinuclease ABC subunit C